MAESKKMETLVTDPAGAIALAAAMLRTRWPMAFSVTKDGDAWQVTFPAKFAAGVRDVLDQVARQDAQTIVARMLAAEIVPDDGGGSDEALH